MWYEINVSLNGRHFFATHKRSLQQESEMKKVLGVMVEKFPESEGFKINLSKWEESGESLDVNEILNKNKKDGN